MNMNYKVPCVLLLISLSLYYLLSPPSPLSDEQLTSHLRDKVVLVCGASSGIGEELAYQLAKHGAKLVLVARSQSKLDSVKEGAIRSGAADVRTISFDFSDVKGSSGVINQTISWFGKLDYFVSNHAATVHGPFLAFPFMQDPSYIERIFRVNLFSHIELTLHALPHLEKSKGHMYLTSSGLGEAPLYNRAIYAATKHALNGFFYSLQQELIARESSVSLTIGAIGTIKTKEIAKVFTERMESMPTFAQGDVGECARGMIESYISRPATHTYPWVAGNIMRFVWYFLPEYHHKLMMQVRKPKYAQGNGYQENVDLTIEKREIKKSINYQQGYDGNDNG